MKTRQCIAVIISKPDSSYQNEMIAGILQEAERRDLNTAVFCSMMQGGGANEFQYGEMNIYNLCNLDRMAGVIFAPDTIQQKGHEALYERIIKECRCPMLMVDWDDESFASVFCDDTTAIVAAIDHLVFEHGCKDIAFMTGTKGHEHATNRLNGYYEAMRKHNLPVYADRVFYGDFWYNQGENVVNALLKSERGLPEAIACASSRMAFSVHEALKKRGYQVPDDVLLTGFNEGASRLDYITYCDRNVTAAGKMAVELLCDLMDGKQVAPGRHICRSEAKVFPSVTCGCRSHELASDSNVAYLDEDNGFHSLYNSMNSALIDIPDFNEWLWRTKWFATLFIKDLSEFYFCMCENWDGVGTGEIIDTPLKTYTKRMNLALTIQGEEATVDFDRWFDLEDMLPRLWEPTEKPQAFFFNALHFQNRCFGYIALSLGEHKHGYDIIYPFWLLNIQNALESQLRLHRIQHLYACMERNAVYDLMTGIHNRNGFNLMSPQLFDEAKQNNYRFMIMMADLNGLKYINDVYGHENGDEIICFSAKTFAGCKVEGASKEATFRIGGDEYVKIAIGDLTEEQIEKCKQSIWTELEEFNKRAKKPYPVHLSMGYCLRSADELTTFDEVMIEADTTMYRNKLELKKKTGFNPKRA